MALTTIERATIPTTLLLPPDHHTPDVPRPRVRRRHVPAWVWMLVVGLVGLAGGYGLGRRQEPAPRPAVEGESQLQAGSRAWGWLSPQAVEPAASPREYLNRLALLAEEWERAPSPPDAVDKKDLLARRLLELRASCSRLVFVDHPLPGDQRQRLQDRARDWARRADELLQQLEGGVSPELVRPDIEKLVKKISGDVRGGLPAH